MINNRHVKALFLLVVMNLIPSIAWCGNAFEDFDRIGNLYTNKYLLSESFSKEKFLNLKKYLENDLGVSEVKLNIEFVCDLGVSSDALKVDEIAWFVRRVLLGEIFLKEGLCKDISHWYAIKIGLMPFGDNPFIQSVALDNLEYFLLYRSHYGYDEILQNFPDMHIYAAHRRACNIVNVLLEDERSDSSLRKAMSDVRFKRYAEDRCGKERKTDR